MTKITNRANNKQPNIELYGRITEFWESEALPMVDILNQNYSSKEPNLNSNSLVLFTLDRTRVNSGIVYEKHPTQSATADQKGLIYDSNSKTIKQNWDNPKIATRIKNPYNNKNINVELCGRFSEFWQSDPSPILDILNKNSSSLKLKTDSLAIFILHSTDVDWELWIKSTKETTQAHT